MLLHFGMACSVAMYSEPVLYRKRRLVPLRGRGQWLQEGRGGSRDSDYVIRVMSLYLQEFFPPSLFIISQILCIQQQKFPHIVQVYILPSLGPLRKEKISFPISAETSWPLLSLA